MRLLLRLSFVFFLSFSLPFFLTFILVFTCPSPLLLFSHAFHFSFVYLLLTALMHFLVPRTCLHSFFLIYWQFFHALCLSLFLSHTRIRMLSFSLSLIRPSFTLLVSYSSSLSISLTLASSPFVRSFSQVKADRIAKNTNGESQVLEYENIH